MRFTECDELAAKYESEPHADNVRCNGCSGAGLPKFDGEKYTAHERRKVLFIAGVRSRKKQDELLDEFGDRVIDKALEWLESLSAGHQWALLKQAKPTVDAPAAAIEGRRVRAVEARDPRNVFNPRHLRSLRAFYRRHGRLPAVITLSFTDEEAAAEGIPSRLIVPPELRADLAHRFDLEQEPEFF
ncbi:hypothetical protein GS463_25895 [Rhodococcus hoagii]|uniref:Uncharacterized protein n=1 Tax=Rhodococcus hoagii TaxID=43767 RepID=A0AAE2W8F3_RHOHA|nr:hypothetical protein [Prescottella equi]MBM4510610.1 hypothetical protein [Prescottella equi]MBM4542415.1 hypothetical protein [Prescottella equi]MBM4715838.1 hypothetical protein [Prescottella equi]NKS14019.1 hypothetical protein [Prescottella equi]